MKLHLFISNNIVSSKPFDKRDDFDFEIVTFPFLDDDVLLYILCSLYFSTHLIS